MTEDAAKGHLRAVLDVFTTGTLLHLLAEIILADARKAGDDLAVERGVTVEATLFVIGLGIDAALPR